MFSNVHCKNTLEGHILTWDIDPKYKTLLVSVYGSLEGKEWVLLERNCPTGRLLVEGRHNHLMSNYKLVGQSTSGKIFECDNIAASMTTGQAARLVKECRRRERLFIKTHPYGEVEATIYMRYHTGEPCPTCNEECASQGANTACPYCWGTGVTKGYYKYPKTEPMLLILQRDDTPSGEQSTSRNNIVKTLRTVFSGWLRTHDLLLIGGELYDIIQQQVASSVADVPVSYNLTVSQLLRNDDRYKLLEREKYGC